MGKRTELGKRDKGKTRKAQSLEREKACWALRVTGMPYQMIADQLKMPMPTVYDACKRAGDKHHTAFMENIQNFKKAQSAIIEKNAFEALLAWQQSKLKSTNTTKKVRPTGRNNASNNQPEMAIEEAYIEERENKGDPRFLKIYLECHEALCKLWGLNILVNDKSGNQVSWENLNIDERIKLFVSIPLEERLKVLKAIQESTKFA